MSFLDWNSEGIGGRGGGGEEEVGNGRFQKISIPTHGRLLGFPKWRGGSRLWNSEGMGGFHRWDV